MTESVFHVDKIRTEASMWGAFRCNKTCVMLIMLNIIIFQSVVYYQEHKKWQEIRSKLEPVIADMEDVEGLTYSLLKRLEVQGLLIDSVLGRTNGTRPIIYAITPTFARPVQKAELTRLAQTFLHIPNFHWIVVEDARQKTPLVTHFLETSGLIYTHLFAATPPNYKLGKNDPNWKKPRGVEQRNAALKWLRENLKPTTDKGVVYFADDDNTYSLRLFSEIGKVQKVGVWPVGLVGGLMVEKPICDNATNKVIGFNAGWKPDRPFPVDMAGFAINVELILNHKDAWFSYDVQAGYQESEILRQLVTKDQLEPLADCCTKVYVWHTRTESPQLNVEHMLIKKGKRSNVGIEV